MNRLKNAFIAVCMAAIFGGVIACVVISAHKPEPRPLGPLDGPQMGAQAAEAPRPDASVGPKLRVTLEAIVQPATDAAPDGLKLDPYDAGLPDLGI